MTTFGLGNNQRPISNFRLPFEEDSILSALSLAQEKNRARSKKKLLKMMSTLGITDLSIFESDSSFSSHQN